MTDPMCITPERITGHTGALTLIRQSKWQKVSIQVTLRGLCRLTWVRIHQPFFRTFFSLFSRFFHIKRHLTVTQLWLSQSRVVLHSICKSWRKRQRIFLRMADEYGPRVDTLIDPLIYTYIVLPCIKNF